MSRELESFQQWIDAGALWRGAEQPGRSDRGPLEDLEPRVSEPTDAELVGALEGERLRHEGVILIDLRERNLFARGHILDALSLPLEELLATWRRGKAVLLYDGDGSLVRLHIRELREAVGELELFVLDRGLEGWAAAGLPLER